MGMKKVKRLESDEFTNTIENTDKISTAISILTDSCTKLTTSDIGQQPSYTNLKRNSNNENHDNQILSMVTYNPCSSTDNLPYTEEIYSPTLKGPLNTYRPSIFKKEINSSTPVSELSFKELSKNNTIVSLAVIKDVYLKENSTSFIADLVMPISGKIYKCTEVPVSEVMTIVKKYASHEPATILIKELAQYLLLRPETT